MCLFKNVYLPLRRSSISTLCYLTSNQLNAKLLWCLSHVFHMLLGRGELQFFQEKLMQHIYYTHIKWSVSWVLLQSDQYLCTWPCMQLIKHTHLFHLLNSPPPPACGPEPPCVWAWTPLHIVNSPVYICLRSKFTRPTCSAHNGRYIWKLWLIEWPQWIKYLLNHGALYRLQIYV